MALGVSVGSSAVGSELTISDAKVAAGVDVSVGDAKLAVGLTPLHPVSRVIIITMRQEILNFIVSSRDCHREALPVWIKITHLL